VTALAQHLVQKLQLVQLAMMVLLQYPHHHHQLMMEAVSQVRWAMYYPRPLRHLCQLQQRTCPLELKKKNARVVVRCCDPSYDISPLRKEGISVLHLHTQTDFPFEDGAAPPVELVRRWLELVGETFREDPENCIAVHCVAGLGRAPVLVAIALIENGMKYHDAVDTIRRKRRGAINQRQLDFLERYKPANRRGSCRLM
jgi:protein tyrosine phosphatase type 4A